MAMRCAGLSLNRRGALWQVTFDWPNTAKRAGSISLKGMSSVAELLEEVVELGEALIGPEVTAASSQVFYATARGESRRMYVTKTRWP